MGSMGSMGSPPPNFSFIEFFLVLLLDYLPSCQQISENWAVYKILNPALNILRIRVTSPILGERISAIILPQQRKQWLSVELNRWRSE